MHVNGTMSPVISGAPVGAIPRRSPASESDLRRTERRLDSERGKASGDAARPYQVLEDPLGLRDSWIKARSAIKKYAEGRKAIKKIRQNTTGNHESLPDPGLERIKDKIEQMRKDLGSIGSDGNFGPMEGKDGEPKKKDLPDRGRDWDRSHDKVGIETSEENQIPPITKIPALIVVDILESIKEQQWGTPTYHQSFQPLTTKSSPAIADQDPRKNNAPANHGEEVDSNGKAGLGSRPLLRGGSSRDRGDLYRTPIGQGVGKSQQARYEGNDHVVAPVFPVDMGVQATSMVELNLSRERAALRSRWIAIGLFFSVQIFNIRGCSRSSGASGA